MKQLNIHILQHLAFEGAGCIEDWIAKHERNVSYTRLYADEQLPGIEDIDLLIVLGGAMNVDEDDKYPWLKEEKAFIARCIAADKAVLGLCLGSQLIVRALGGRVYPNAEKEIGWLPVQRVMQDATHPLHYLLPEMLTVFQWHGDTYDVPMNSLQLYRSAGCNSQSFLYANKVLAIQFHPEANETLVNAMLEHEGGELEQGGAFVQTADGIRAGMKNTGEANELMFALLDYLANA